PPAGRRNGPPNRDDDPRADRERDQRSAASPGHAGDRRRNPRPTATRTPTTRIPATTPQLFETAEELGALLDGAGGIPPPDAIGPAGPDAAADGSGWPLRVGSGGGPLAGRLAISCVVSCR